MDQLTPKSNNYFSNLNKAIELLKKYHKLYENSGSKDPDLIMLANKVLGLIVELTDSLRRLFDHYFTMAYKVINEYEEDSEKVQGRAGVVEQIFKSEQRNKEEIGRSYRIVC